MDFLNTILIAVVMFALLAGLALLYGVLEYTTDKEFRTRKFLRDSYRRIPPGKRKLIFALAAAMAIIYLASNQLTDVAWLNWTLLIVAMGIEIFYLVWTFRISDRIRELIVGGALLLATWPIFGSLCANLCATDNIDSGPIGWVRLFVVCCVAILIAGVCVRICRKLEVVERWIFRLNDFIPKEEKTNES